MEEEHTKVRGGRRQGRQDVTDKKGAVMYGRHHPQTACVIKMIDCGVEAEGVGGWDGGVRMEGRGGVGGKE